MPTIAFVESTLLLFVLLNPFLLSIYLLDLIQQMDGASFRRAMVRGALISGAAFLLFALAGDAIFARVLQVRFASFLIFGGVVFLVLGVRYMMVGAEAIRGMRGPAEHVAGSIALPFMIGPGTVSASVLAGSRLPFGYAALAIGGALLATTLGVLVLKRLYDWVTEQNERYVQRYVDIVGRISGLVIGSIAVEMILQGVELWVEGL